MDSQEDMFATQATQVTQSTQVTRATQDVKKGQLNYAFLVLCDKNEEVMNPFGLFPRSMFSSKEILDRWLNSILDHSSRLKSLHTLDNNLSLFGKIEEGKYFFIINPDEHFFQSRSFKIRRSTFV